MTNGIEIKLNHVTKKYQQTTIIDEMDLTVHAGEFLVLLGPSGCGKSTTLRMIAGLESISSGELMIDHTEASHVPSGQRNIAMVFQDYALYPNMTVRQNIEYALRIHKMPRDQRQAKIDDVLNALNLTKHQDQLPSALSGGQKQRVALGRGMAKDSQIFLLDEPLSNIDVQLREQARNRIIQLHRASGQTIIYVTHDQLEAMALGDRIAVINDGKIQMVGTPDDVYRHPANLFVATFIGSPQINLLEVVLQESKLLFNGEVLSVLPQSVSNQLTAERYILGIRSEDCYLHTNSEEPTSIPVTVKDTVDYGRFIQYTLALDSDQTIKVTTTQSVAAIGDIIYLTIETSKLNLFDVDTNQNVTPVSA